MAHDSLQIENYKKKERRKVSNVINLLDRKIKIYDDVDGIELINNIIYEEVHKVPQKTPPPNFTLSLPR